MRRPEKKRREEDIKDNKTNKANRKTVALLQLEFMPLQLRLQVVMARRKRKLTMSPRSLVIVVTKIGTISPIIPSQKISYNLNDFYIGGY